MRWHYLKDNRPAGPVDDAALRRLARTGALTPESLVWREGLAEWIPLALADLADEAPAAGEGRVFCAECGRPRPPSEMIPWGSAWICADCKPAFFQKVREGAAVAAPVAGGSIYANFWLRVVAKLLDRLILTAVSYLILIPAGLVFFALFAREIRKLEAQKNAAPPVDFIVKAMAGYGAVVLIMIGLQLLYSAWFNVRKGGTPGKLILGMRVVTPDGATLSWGRAVGRFFAEWVTGMTCGIGHLIALFDGEVRTLHDHLAGTRVVKK